MAKQEVETQQTESLTTLFDSTAPQVDLRCRVDFHNRTPADWGFIVTEIACKWIFDRGSKPSDESQGKRTNIAGPNGVEFLKSNNNLCTKGVWGLMRVRDSEGTEQIHEIWSTTPPPGQCSVNVGFVLAPNSFLSPAAQNHDRVQIRVLV